MGNYEELKTAIQQVVAANGNNEITGDLMQNVLLSVINSLGKNMQYAGIATPSTNPGTPDQNIFYIANTPGIYVNFNALPLEMGEVAIITWNGNWSKSQLFIIRGDSIIVNEPYFPISEHEETEIAIEPNVFHKWGVITSLNITLLPPTDLTITNEYILEFAVGETIPTITFTDNLKFSGDLEITANKIYQISIVNNLVVWSAF